MPQQQHQSCGEDEAERERKRDAQRQEAAIADQEKRLADQVQASIQQLAGNSKIRSATVYGGVAMAPHGGIDRLVALNPVAWAAPTNRPWAFNLDMATSVVAGSKVALAIEKGEKIPFGWAIDADGNPTDDPHAAMKGAMLPLGDQTSEGRIGFTAALIAGMLLAIVFMPGEDRAFIYFQF